MRSCESRPVSRVRRGIATALVLCVSLGGLPISAATPPGVSKEAPPSVVASVGDPEGDILLNVGAIVTGTPEAQGLRKAVASFEGRRLHLVQFAGPIQPEWYASLLATGVEVIQYIPANSYLVYGDAAAVASLQSMARTSAVVRWDGPYLDHYKIQPAADVAVRAKLGLAGDRDEFAIQLVADPEVNAETRKLVASLSAKGLKQNWEILRYSNLVAELPLDAVAEIATRPDVVSIDRHVRPELFDERQNRIISGQLTGNLPTAGDHLAYLAGKGFTQAQFTTSGFVVDVTDSGIDNGTTTPNHFGLRLAGDLASAGRVQYSRLEGTANAPSTIQGCDGHGNLNAHIVAGYVPDPSTMPSPGTHTDASGFRYGLGVCPFVKVGSSVIFDPGYTDPSYPDLQARAYADNARISTNSWGSHAYGAYTVDAQAYDALVRDAQPASSAVPAAGNQEMVIIFSAGNDGSSANSIGAPGVAKNVISVGASEGVQAFGGAGRMRYDRRRGRQRQRHGNLLEPWPRRRRTRQTRHRRPGNTHLRRRLPGLCQQHRLRCRRRVLRRDRRVRRAQLLQLLPDDSAVLLGLVRHEPLGPGRGGRSGPREAALHQQRPDSAEPGHDQGRAHELGRLHDRHGCQ